MKPNFILDLTQDGIRLRTAGGDKNVVLGEVKLSEPDFEEKVAALRNAVAEKSDVPLATELRIPDSEILYTTLDDPEFDAKTAKGSRDDLRDALVRDALEGMTPYALNDLNYIWKVKGKGELTIAAVSHETLAEAEQFAANRGFNPVRFTADPGAKKFKGTVDFGPTQTQRTRTAAQARAAAEKAKAEAEAEALKKAEAARAKAEADAAPPATTQNSTDAGAAPAKANPAAASDSPAAPAQGAPAGAKADPAPNSAASVEPAFTGNAASARNAASVPGKRPSSTAAQEPHRAKVQPAPSPSSPSSGATPKASTPELAGTDAPRVGFSQPRVNDPLPPLDDGAVLNDVPAMPAVSFASRRKPDDRPKVTTGPRSDGPLSPGVAADVGEKDSRLSRIAARFAVAPGADSLAKAAVPPPPPRRTPAGPLGAAAKPALQGSAGKPGTAGRPGPARDIPVGTLPDNTAAADSLTPPGHTGVRLPDTVYRPRRTEAEAMTVFGARTALPRRSYTPVIIGIALIAALAIAVWAAFLLIGDKQVTGETGALLPESAVALLETPAPRTAGPAPSETETEGRAPQPESTPEPSSLAAALPQEQPDADTSGAALPGTTDAIEPANGRISAPDSTVATLGPVAPPAPMPEALILSQTPPPPLANDLLQRPPAGDANSENVVARYATSGVWVQTPSTPEAPVTDGVDDLYIASIDPSIVQPATPGTASLPPLLSAPNGVMPQLPPAGPGQTFDLDERGLVRATPEGALTPDGIVITAGPPPRRPPTAPARPDTLVPTAETQPDLPRIRPRDRPGNVAEGTDQSELSLPDNSQIAALQPQPRPDNTTSTDTDTSTTPPEETGHDGAGASTATPQAPLSTRPPRPAPANLAALRPTPEPEPEPEAVAATPAEPISPYAVAQSRLPRERPRNIDRIIAQTRIRAPEVQQQPQVTRVAAPAAVTTPSIPSRASVAQQATVKNAINLGRINLIGVYGSNSNRSALVRLPSGKFVTLKVGDRVDGGRVAAIGQSQLSYSKGGRQILLAMPKG